MDLEKEKERTMAAHKLKKASLDSEQHELKPTGDTMMRSLMDDFGYSHKSQLAALFAIETDTLVRNWAKKLSGEFSGWSERLPALYNAVEKMKNAHIPKSALLGLVEGKIVDGSGPSIIETIIDNPKNVLIGTVIHLFTDKMLREVDEEQILVAGKDNELTDEQLIKYKEQFK